MKNIDLEKWKNEMIESAKQNFNKDKSLAPVVLMLTEKTQYIIAAPFSTQEQKEMVAYAIKKMAREKKAIAVIFIHEAWMISVSADEKNKIMNEDGTMKKAVKDTEGRVEAIIIQYETKAGEKEMTIIEINDKKLGKVKTAKGGDVQGLFTNFFETPTWVN